MTKKMKRERTPTPVDDSVAQEMEVRLAYKNLIDSFNEDQKTLEERINEQVPQNASTDDTPSPEGDNDSGSAAP